jgi:hypothetical protein
MGKEILANLLQCHVTSHMASKKSQILINICKNINRKAGSNIKVASSSTNPIKLR